MNNEFISIKIYSLSYIFLAIFLFGCSMYDVSTPGVYTWEHRNFSSLSAHHNELAMLPIAVKISTNMATNTTLNDVSEEISIHYDQDLQQYLYNELVRGYMQGRITIEIQNPLMTNNKFHNDTIRRFKSISVAKSHRLEICELLGVDVLGHVELFLTLGEESLDGSSLHVAMSTATYYDCKNGMQIWRFQELVTKEEMLKYSGSIRERLLKRVSWFFPYEVILG